MAESDVVRVAREYREQLARNEDQALRRMARSWYQMERELQAEYFNIAQQIQDLADSGVPVPKEWLYQQRRYQEMLQQVDKAIADYDKDAVTVISDYQRENWNLGLESARAQVKTSDPSSWIWNKVSRDSAETMAGFAGNGAPLAELLKRDYADLGQRVTDALITGIGLGKGAHAVAKDMRDAMSIDYDRSVRIARTEINRAYRLANAEQYRRSGVVEKVLRLCYPPTACFACLEMDGEECPNGICDDHPNGKCTTIAVTVGGVMPEWQHGHDWLMEQSEEDQRRIIGDERYELWKKDHIPLRDMVQMKPNPVWGGSPSVVSINNLKQRYNIGSGLSAISLPQPPTDDFDRSKVQHSPAGKALVDRFEKRNVEYRKVPLFDKQPTEEEIIQRLGGGDRTKGSCASLAYAYAGEKNGMDVLDFRDGASREIMALGERELSQLGRASGVTLIEKGSSIRPAKALLGKVEKGKEYILSTGRHAAIVRKTDEGKLQYLELQNVNSGWRDFEGERVRPWGTFRYSTSDTLRDRFACGQKSLGISYLTDISVFQGDDELRDILGFVNTAPDKQKKGSAGHER